MKHLMLLSLLSLITSFQNPTYANTSEEETKRIMQSASPAPGREISSERQSDTEKEERRQPRKVPHHQGGLEDR